MPLIVKNPEQDLQSLFDEKLIGTPHSVVIENSYEDILQTFAKTFAQSFFNPNNLNVIFPPSSETEQQTAATSLMVPSVRPIPADGQSRDSIAERTQKDNDNKKLVL